MSEIDFNAKITNHAGHSADLSSLCERLETAGFRVQGTRLDSYRKTFATINKFITENRLGHELRDKVSDSTFVNDLHESHEFLEACREFPDLTQPGLRDRLEKALKGPRELEKETPEKGEPRNFLFELVMAALLKRAGLVIHLDRIEDAFFEFAERPFFMECKRIHSLIRLQKLIDEAASQIGKRCDGARTKKARGIIAIDVSKLLNAGDNLFQSPTLKELNSECKNLLGAFRVMRKSHLGSKKEKRVLGVYMYCRLPGRVLLPPGTHSCRQSSFTISHSPETKDSALAVRFFKKIRPAATD